MSLNHTPTEHLVCVWEKKTTRNFNPHKS